MTNAALFVTLRNTLATLYIDEASTRRVISDADLDERRIAISSRAINTWHAILVEAIQVRRVDALLGVALKDYESNATLSAAYTEYLAQGNKLTIPGLAEADATNTRSQREIELAYLDELIGQYQYWAEKYTPLAGIAEVRSATAEGPQLDLPLFFMPTGFEKLVELGFGEQRRVERVPVDDLREAITRYKRLVLLGEPGAGKTTTLWRLVHDYAQTAKTNELMPLPILVPMGMYTGTETLFQYISKHCEPIAAFLSTYLRQGTAILLLDGLNEMPRNDYAERIQRVQTLLTQFPAVPVVVTCRALDYVEALALEKLEVKPLDVTRQLAYLQRYLGEREGEQLFWQLAGGEDVAALWKNWQHHGGTWIEFWFGEKLPERFRWNLSWQQRDLWQSLQKQEPPLLALGHNPYMLVMLAQVYVAQHTISQNRGRLFAAFVATLLAREEKRCDPSLWPGVTPLQEGLAQLAYAMQVAKERGTAVDEAWAAIQIVNSHCTADELLYLATNATLLEWRDHTVRFVHQLLQDYFAALALHQKWQAGAPLDLYCSPDWSEPSGWEETFVLLAGFTPDLAALVSDLLPVNPPLAARCMAEGGTPTAPSIMFQKVQDALVTLATSNSTVVRQRHAAGNALNYLSDPRPGVGLTAAGMPNLVWCVVPAGKFFMGNVKRVDKMMLGDKSSQHLLHLSTFAVSKYPITNAQYRAFVSDGGYSTRWLNCWTTAGWQWRKDHGINEPARYGGVLDSSNHPVVGVSWYEAIAFCRWLSSKLERQILLPSEAEWEKACGVDGRRYPWNDKQISDHANYNKMGIGTTTTVGIFPKGQSPYGVLDMAGNVVEWTRSLSADYPYRMDDGPEDLESIDCRVVRGGSFISSAYSLRCSFRDHVHDPDFRNTNVGFRVVCHETEREY